MPTYSGHMRVTYIQIWSVEAKDADEAKRKFNELDESVVTDDAGEVIDWECSRVEPEKD